MTNTTVNKNVPLLHLTNLLQKIGKAVVLDSGLYIVQRMIQPGKFGVFISAVIKKHRYWPINVPRQKIDNYTKTKQIEDVFSVLGKIYY